MFENSDKNCEKFFDEAKPSPTSADFHTQVGVHCEEVHEMLIEISTDDDETLKLLNNARISMTNLASHLKGNEGVIHVESSDEINFLDALCDQRVTAIGIGVFCGFDMPGANREVDESNLSKFVDGKAILDENGKIMKGPDYRKADLAPFLTR